MKGKTLFVAITYVFLQLLVNYCMTVAKSPEWYRQVDLNDGTDGTMMVQTG